jgi:FlaA1/EpsC-like NDP-sugar epimerase
MELHPGEAILGNVIGTKNLLDVVAGFGAERFVFVSSNEAANPVNVMGATKRIGELLVQSAAESGRVRAGSVRLGSVLGSRGSVVPLFRRQIASGGPVTVTHPDAQRCFITMRQGVQLILAAGCEARRGEIFVAENGTPRNIKELAQEMILLAGLEPGKDIEIRIVGLRPGEYLVKDIVTPTQRLSRTRFEGVSVIEPTGVDHRKLTQNMSQLVQAARSANPRGIDVILGMMGLSYKPVRPPPSVSVRPPLPSRSAEGQETLQSSPSAGPVGEGPAT